MDDGSGTTGTRAHGGEEIVAAARELLEQEGADALSMRRLADRIGIRAPSIYKHLPDKRALENALISAGFEELAAAFRRRSARRVRPCVGRSPLPTGASHAPTRTSIG